jgi:L-threonylcarbamoyladenylate synthase
MGAFAESAGAFKPFARTIDGPSNGRKIAPSAAVPIVPATPDSVTRGARMLLDGRLVAFPTETVYGLGADATNALAVAAIFEAKGRPRFNPLISHVADAEAALGLGRFSPMAERLVHKFWPGALTLVVPRRPDCPIADLATAGLDTVALRVPSHPIARALLAAVARPVAAPSANRSGHVSATSAAHVEADLGDRVALILDGGLTEHGLESTILDVSHTTPRLLRPGAIPAEELEEVTGGSLLPPPATGDRPSSPGQLASHYAPGAAVRLNAATAQPGEALLAFGSAVPSHLGPVINLSRAGDLREAAANLFAALRNLDRAGVSTIAVMPIPSHGLGAAINDRLQRAAAPKSDAVVELPS